MRLLLPFSGERPGPRGICIELGLLVGLASAVSFLSRADGTVSEHLRLCSSALCACLVQVLKVLSLAVCSVSSMRSGAALAVGYRSRFRGSQWLCASVAWRPFPASARLWSAGLVPRCGCSGVHFGFRVLSECPSGALVGLFRALAGSSPPRAAGYSRTTASAAAPAPAPGPRVWRQRVRRQAGHGASRRGVHFAGLGYGFLCFALAVTVSVCCFVCGLSGLSVSLSAAGTII